MHLIRLRQERKRQPRRGTIPKTQAANSQRRDDRRIVPLPVRTTQERKRLRVMQLVRTTNQGTDERRIVIRVPIFPPVHEPGDEVSR